MTREKSVRQDTRRNKAVKPDEKDRVQQVVQETKALIQMLEKTSVRRVSLQAGEFKIEVERTPTQARSLSLDQAVPEAATPRDSHHRVRSPLAGTFYGAPKPGAKPFVEVGSRVERSQPIGIIDVMKVMNEVPSDAAGVVVEILVQDKEAVQFDQPLIVIDTTA